MNEIPKNESKQISDEAISLLAKELLRLASSITRNIKENAALKSLSHLTAMQPIQNMLMEQLSSNFFEQQDSESPDTPQTTPGYL
jgi:hydroxymethylpyrimidine/phosphomethylpyrimidine kinase